MEPFQRLSSGALTIMDENIDTDIIFPARFLLIMEKHGLGRYLFHDRRFTAAGDIAPDSPLDGAGADQRKILIAGANFGCGSSREHAVWALAGFGLRCVVAPSFGEIFYANCFNSGVLPISLPQEVVTDLARRADLGMVFDVDLDACSIATGDGDAVSFAIDPGRRDALLNGRDVIDTIMHEELANIEQFEVRHQRAQPWLFD